MPRAWSAIVGLLIAASFYWVLIDTTSTPELIAGAVAAVIATLAYSAAYLESTWNAAFKPGWLPVVLREFAKVPRGVLIVCREILAQTFAPRAQRGVLAADPFEVGDGDSYDIGLRALTEASRSLAPDTIVIGVDADSGGLVLHRLGATR
jgi:hypothetical protein